MKAQLETLKALLSTIKEFDISVNTWSGVGYEGEELQIETTTDVLFTVSFENGKFIVLAHYGRDRDTNAPEVEREFTSKSVEGVKRVLKREVKVTSGRWGE
jgi:hypothetical protein